MSTVTVRRTLLAEVLLEPFAARCSAHAIDDDGILGLERLFHKWRQSVKTGPYVGRVPACCGGYPRAGAPQM